MARTIRLVVAVVVVGLGLGATALELGFAGGVLYALLVALLISLALPRLRPTVVGGLAALVCFTVEVSQLSGAPAAAVQAVPALRYVLGTTFDAVDLVAYLIGAALGATAVHMINRSSPAREDAQTVTPRVSSRTRGR